MKVAWLSSRVLGTDLCATTQINLANCLVENGYDVTLYSPGKCDTNLFKHVSIIRSSRRGLQSYSVRRDLEKNLAEINQYDIVLIDWTVATMTKKIVPPTIIIDRSPPADRGILSRLQWHWWKKAWKNAEYGTVVSSKHRSLVLDYATKLKCNVAIIPAGVDTNVFVPAIKNKVIHLVYHGRLNYNRGVMRLPTILTRANNIGLNLQLHIHGEGDCLGKLQSLLIEGLEVTSTLTQEELAVRLSSYDIGLLPMPNYNNWNIASPLKRSEYLASGLAVCGIDHSGHQIANSGNWLQLFDQENFVEKTVEWLSKLSSEKLENYQKQAREYAEKHLSWSHSAKELEALIIESTN